MTCWSRGFIFAFLAMAMLVGCASAPPVRIGLPRILMDNHQLVLGTARGTSEVEVTFAILDVPEVGYNNGAYYLKSTLFVERADDESLVATVRVPERKLSPGTSKHTVLFELNAATLGIEPGAYMVQPVMLVATRRDLDREIDELFAAQWASRKHRFDLTIGKPVGIQILSDTDGNARRYETMIASGDPNLVYRGLSQLIMHYRMRGQFQRAEKVAKEVSQDYSDSADVARFQPIFLSWATDDITAQGDYLRAAELLRKEAKRTPLAGFLGEPFGAQALRQQARIWRQAGDSAGEIAAYTELIDNYSFLDRWPEARADRANAYLRAGDFPRARSDFAVIAAAADRCPESRDEPVPEPITLAAATTSTRPPDSTGCPPGDLVATARKHLAILDSDRAWYQLEPGPIVSEIQQAFAERDITRLDALASVHDFKFGYPGAHYQPAVWQGKIRSFFSHLLESRELTFNNPRGDPTIPGQLILLGTDADAPETEATTHFFVIENTPYGWQWGAVGPANFPSSLARIIDDIDDGNGDGPGGGGGGSGGGGGRLPTPSTPHFKAPWAPGTHMRAGGLPFSVKDIINTLHFKGVVKALVNIFFAIDRCGAGVPGFFYNMTETHQGQNYYAVDYTRGAKLFCLPGFLGGACAPNPVEALAELTTALAVGACQKAGGCDDTPIMYGAYQDPVHAAHAGVVIRHKYDQPNGDKATSNLLEMAVWTYPPTSAVSVASQTVLDPTADPETRTLRFGAVTALNRLDPQPDYWVRYLHLAERANCPFCVPSLGMWIPRGQMIGLIDDTGNSFISHLHFDALRRPASDVDALDGDKWMSSIQFIEEDFLGENDNGKCIKSTNELDVGDFDSDGIPDGDDNCFVVANTSQTDTDGNGVGDACDPSDRDNDGIPDAEDSCPDDFDSPRWIDINGDGILDKVVADTDGDGIGDACDPDIDGDGRANADDVCLWGDDDDDLDSDGIPDLCDFDADGDGFANTCGFPDPGLLCPCRPDTDDRNPAVAGDYDNDGIDATADSCPCDDLNPDCSPLPRVEGAGVLQLYMVDD